MKGITKYTNTLGNRYRGRIGKDMIASSWKGIPYLRTYRKPRNPRSGPQQENRHSFGDAAAAWRGLSPAEQRAYNRKAVRMSGLNLFVRKRMKARKRAGPRGRVP